MISETSRAALAAALCKKGPNKGKLLRSAPRSSTPAYAAWQAAMLCVNPFKASIGGMMFMSEAQRAIHREVLAYFDAMPKADRIKYDADRASLERLGVW